VSQRTARMIRHAIRSSERFEQLNWRERDFFYGLLTWADDFGRFEANPAVVRTGLYVATLRKISVRDVQEMLVRCHQLGLIQLYTVAGRGFGKVLRYNQRLTHKVALNPPPPEDEGAAELELGFQPSAVSKSSADTATGPPAIVNKSECFRPSKRREEKNTPQTPHAVGGLISSSGEVAKRRRSPERVRKELIAERIEVERELEEILRPGGTAYNITPTGEKKLRYEQLMARRKEILTELGSLKKQED